MAGQDSLARVAFMQRHHGCIPLARAGSPVQLEAVGGQLRKRRLDYESEDANLHRGSLQCALPLALREFHVPELSAGQHARQCLMEDCV